MSQTADGPVPLWVTNNSCDRLITVGTFKVVITPCTLIYRFVHTPGTLGNTPEMLGAARPESEGFSAQAHMGQQRHDVPTQPNSANV